LHLSTLALEGSSEGDGRERAPAAVRYLDLIVLAIALPVFLIFGFPILGYVVCAAAWLLGRGLHLAAERRAKAALAKGNRKGALGTMGAATLGRVWLVALAILLVGLADRKAGLSGALLAVVVVTTYFAAQGIAYVLEPEEHS
jgi:hypothetical protein